jgi:flagellar assembly factor FliW
MFVDTVRFGRLEVAAKKILLFPDGLVGFEDDKHWILLADGESESVGWLQSIGNAELALPVVTPQRFISDYSLRMKRTELKSLPWKAEDQAIVLVVVSHSQRRLTMNLKAPLVINLNRCLGKQVISVGGQPLKYEFPLQSDSIRQSA